MSLPSSIRLRRSVCALALPAFPLALLAGALVSPTDSIDNAVQLRAAAAHPSAWQGAALLELLAAVLLPLGIAGVVAAVRGRGSALANAAGLFGVLGTLGMTLIGARHLFVHGLAGGDHGAALAVLDRLDSGSGAVVFLLMFGGPLALIAATAAAVRAGIAPRWTIAGTVAFVVVDMLPIPEAELVQGLVGIAAFAVLARRLLGGEESAPSRRATTPAAAPVLDV